MLPDAVVVPAFTSWVRYRVPQPIDGGVIFADPLQVTANVLHHDIVNVFLSVGYVWDDGGDLTWSGGGVVASGIWCVVSSEEDTPSSSGTAVGFL